ncbi:hypothetical protein F0357_17265 [Rhizobiales bacterium Sp-1]|uniref:TIGR02186 family protein n=1 Tax=Segnochrobactrum spirostomi TaxID=2608987 RepID=A0A6A7Y6P1_9HYPH|nr:hypothetical protein [Segnochrobactrum spirostomi]
MGSADVSGIGAFARRAAALGLVAAALAAAPGAAWAETVVASVSSPKIKIQSNFSGADIVVFGVISAEGGGLDHGPPYDVVVVVRGPPEHVAARRKERVAGLWIGGASREYPLVPSFYALDSNRPLADAAAPATLDAYGIGAARASFGAATATGDDGGFRDALIRLREHDGLFAERSGSVVMLTPTFFRATVPLPKKVPNGDYRVEVFVFSDRVLAARTLLDLTVRKEGFEAAVHDFAVGRPFLYGLAVVAMAVGIGWIGGVVFRRD